MTNTRDGIHGGEGGYYSLCSILPFVLLQLYAACAHFQPKNIKQMCFVLIGDVFTISFEEEKDNNMGKNND